MDKSIDSSLSPKEAEHGDDVGKQDLQYCFCVLVNVEY